MCPTCYCLSWRCFRETSTERDPYGYHGYCSRERRCGSWVSSRLCGALRGLNLCLVGDDPRAAIEFEYVLQIGLLRKPCDYRHHSHRDVSTFGCSTPHRFRGLHRHL